MLYGTCDFAVHESTTFGTTITKGMGKKQGIILKKNSGL
jgi:hypothetical protein